MKYKLGAVLALVMVLFAACAGAQQLPSISCFSPGLIQVSEKLRENPTISMDAELTVENAFYARNLSVLQAMLEGAVFHVEADGATSELTLSRNGETLMQAALTQDEQGARVSLDGTAYDIATPDEAAWADTPTFMQDTPILERVPLTSIAAWLEGMNAGDSVGFGAAAASAFDVKRTMSDDGERLTKLNIAGQVDFEGETWQISGFLRQPGGKAPKDTFELTFQKDEKNVVELVYSALRQDEIEQKNRKGRTSVTTTLKADGKIEGYKVYLLLKVSQKNDWTADGEKLNEKITVSVNMTQKDNRPAKRMQWLNQTDTEGKSVIRIVTTEDAADSYTLTHELNGKLMMNSNTVLQGGASMNVTVGGERTSGAQAEQDAAPQTLEEAVRLLSRRLYQQLDEQTKKSISDGL